MNQFYTDNNDAKPIRGHAISDIDELRDRAKDSAHSLSAIERQIVFQHSPSSMTARPSPLAAPRKKNPEAKSSRQRDSILMLVLMSGLVATSIIYERKVGETHHGVNQDGVSVEVSPGITPDVSTDSSSEPDRFAAVMDSVVQTAQHLSSVSPQDLSDQFMAAISKVPEPVRLRFAGALLKELSTVTPNTITEHEYRLLSQQLSQMLFAVEMVSIDQWENNHNTPAIEAAVIGQ